VYDLLIKGAIIVDGTGNPRSWGDVAVVEGRIAALGHLKSARARRAIDASGLVACPGFIDIHTHSDATLLVNPRADGKVRQGVTLEVVGHCGYSLAPLYGEAVEMATDALSQHDLELSWRTVGEYLGAVEHRGIALNFATVVGHGCLRVGAMGHVRRPPTRDELDLMKRRLSLALAEGAFGLSTGLVYPPSSYAAPEEIIDLARVLAYHGGIYFTHLRNESAQLLEAVREAIRVGEEAGVPVQICHHKVIGEPNWGKVVETLRVIDQARLRGVDITLDQYPYTASATSLTVIIPGWAQEGGKETLLNRLRDPELRARLREEVEENQRRIGGWARLRVSSVQSAANKQYEGLSIEDIAERRGACPVDVALDLILEERGNVGCVRFGMHEDDVRTVMRHPAVMVGSDGRALAVDGPLSVGKPHPRSYGTFPRVLGKYVREEEVLTLEDAVRKMTSLPAARLGLWDRGLLRPGFWADIVLFDPSRVRDRATYDNPHQYPEGIHWVLINGVPVVDEGEHTGALPGMVLRRHDRA